MTIKYALQEGFINLIRLDDGGVGYGVSSFIEKRIKLEPHSSTIELDGKEAMIITHETVQDYGIDHSIVKELYELVSKGEFIVHHPSEFIE